MTGGQKEENYRNHKESNYKKAITKIKNKKAADRLGWKAECIKDWGEETVKVFIYYLTGSKQKIKYQNSSS